MLDGVIKDIIEIKKVENIEEVDYNNHKYNSYGYSIIIEHAYGFSTQYTNLESVFVKVGEKVKKGQTIGLLGKNNDVNLSYLNYIIKQGNTTFNPEKFLLLN